jgi:imidazolonepropionase-like amidohydrolase
MAGKYAGRVTLFSGLATLVATLYLAATPLPEPANNFTNPEWIGPVRIVDAATATIVSGRALQIEDGRITRVVPIGTLTAGQRRELVDVGGSYVMPALWDMHALSRAMLARLNSR